MQKAPPYSPGISEVTHLHHQDCVAQVGNLWRCRRKHLVESLVLQCRRLGDTLLTMNLEAGLFIL